MSGFWFVSVTQQISKRTKFDGRNSKIKNKLIYALAESVVKLNGAGFPLTPAKSTAET